MGKSKTAEKDTTKTDAGRRLTTGRVRLSFPHLFKPYTGPDGDQDPKYSVMLLIDKKKGKDTLKALRAAEEEAVLLGIETKFGGKRPARIESILHDADEDGSAEDWPERKGCVYMSVSAGPDFKPQIVDRDVQEILDQSEVYSGVYARVSVTAFPYTYGKKKGVSFGLNNVQILGGGESLGGGRPASADFGAVDEDDLL
jgi:hypothetical protein